MHWFTEFLKILSRQTFNPRLISNILEKLKIIPSPDHTSPDQPTILESIVDSLNATNFWGEIMELLAVSTEFEGEALVVFSRYLRDHRERSLGKNEAQSRVFYALKVFKNLLELSSILRYAQKACPTHFMTRLLSKLKYLNEFDTSQTSILLKRSD